MTTKPRTFSLASSNHANSLAIKDIVGLREYPAKESNRDLEIGRISAPQHTQSAHSKSKLVPRSESVIIAFVEQMHQETIAILEGLTPEGLERKGLSPQGVPITTWKLLRAMIEHEVHHRGEMYVYLALLGVPRPPLFGLTSEELARRSVHVGT